MGKYKNMTTHDQSRIEYCMVIDRHRTSCLTAMREAINELRGIALMLLQTLNCQYPECYFVVLYLSIKSHVLPAKVKYPFLSNSSTQWKYYSLLEIKTLTVRWLRLDAVAVHVVIQRYSKSVSAGADEYFGRAGGCSLSCLIRTCQVIIKSLLIIHIWPSFSPQRGFQCCRLKVTNRNIKREWDAGSCGNA